MGARAAERGVAGDAGARQLLLAVTTIREVAGRPRWQRELEELALREPLAVLDPAGYADVLVEAGCEVDAWETTYLQRLSGPDPVLEWVTGTALRPIKAALDDMEAAEASAGSPNSPSSCARPTRLGPTASPGSRSAACSPSPRCDVDHSVTSPSLALTTPATPCTAGWSLSRR